MNYSNHSLRTDIQEWKNRLYRATNLQFGHQLKYLMNNLESNLQLQGIINKAVATNKFEEKVFKRFSEDGRTALTFEFKSEEQQASFCFQFLKYIIKISGDYNIHNLILFQGRDLDGTKSNIIENYISPIIYYLHDKLDKSNSVIYLLEKYKKRTEWFTKEKLYNSYNKALKSYEQIFEDDLRLFLFDQGIDYPFSTPSSSSGRADIIGEIETEDPLVVEIKIFDREKGYGKDRVKDGFTQIVRYANDYNKDVGYLVIYNLESIELNFKLKNNDNIFPPVVEFNNKLYYLIIINIAIQNSASKSGKLKEIQITEDELTKIY